jgi:hypothetical protein
VRGPPSPFFSPRVRLGRAQQPSLAQLPRASVFPSWRFADVAGPHVRSASFLKPSVTTLSKFLHRPNPSPNLPLSLFGASPGYITRGPHPAASISSLRSVGRALEASPRARGFISPPPSASPSQAPPSAAIQSLSCAW